MLTHLIHLGSLMDRIPTPVLFLYDLFVLFVITLAIIRRRGFAGTLAWIFAIIAFPGVGVLGYLLLANPHVARTRRAKRAATRQLRHHRGASAPLPAQASGARTG